MVVISEITTKYGNRRDERAKIKIEKTTNLKQILKFSKIATKEEFYRSSNQILVFLKTQKKNTKNTKKTLKFEKRDGQNQKKMVSRFIVAAAEKPAGGEPVGQQKRERQNRGKDAAPRRAREISMMQLAIALSLPGRAGECAPVVRRFDADTAAPCAARALQ